MRSWQRKFLVLNIMFYLKDNEHFLLMIVFILQIKNHLGKIEFKLY